MLEEHGLKVKEESENHEQARIPGNLQPLLEDLMEGTRKSIRQLEEDLEIASQNAKQELNRTHSKILEYNSFQVEVSEEMVGAVKEYLLSSKAIFSILDALYSRFPSLTLLFLREILSEQAS